MSDTLATCPKCRADLSGIRIAVGDGCPRCGAALHDAEKARPNVGRWVAAIVMGLSLQIAALVLLIAFPPGTLAGLVAYIGIGLLGLLELMFGSFGLRRETALREQRVVHDTPRDMPRHAQHCPDCRASLAATIGRRERHCPDCGRHFTLRELGGAEHDPAGEPASLAPNERRISGAGVAVTVFLLLVMLVGFAVVAMTMSPQRPPPAAPTPTPNTAPTP